MNYYYNVLTTTLLTTTLRTTMLLITALLQILPIYYIYILQHTAETCSASVLGEYIGVLGE